MNRPIKYQAWQQYAMQMYEVVGLQWSAAIAHKFSKIELLSMDGLHTAYTATGAVCDSYVLREYTGLKDKHGKDIFEGDIILVEEYDIGTVAYLKAVFAIVFLSGHKLALQDAMLVSISVIGNVYETPELLPKKGF